MMDNSKQKIWFITGISSGLGKALAEAVIESGDMVIGTLRNTIEVDVFNNKHREEAFSVLMDVTNTAEIEKAFQVVKEKYGRIDVLVNNAGVGLAGAIEETSLTETRAMFEANFFGALQVTQAALPFFRQQRSGHIIQISSHGGVKAMAGFGIYNASKFALEGFSEALAAEVAPLGIKLTIVEPGPFRTNFAGDSFRQAEKTIEDYHATAGAFRERIKQANGKQEGDPYKAARAIMQIAGSENPPLRLPLGKTAIATITAKLASIQKDVDTFREVAEQAIF
ncbi:MAG: SDR family NAD(P)-dependent oxidoreductase [Rhizobacter sp.]|nr:SDR family NAD(P)-dependent oxidoreductase [Chlorobiales bacterium]